MVKRRIIIGLGAAIASLAGCISEATGPPFTPLSVDRDRALVYFYLCDSMGTPFHIYADGQQIGELRSHGYFPYVTTPRIVTFSVAPKATADDGTGLAVLLGLKPNHTYFVQLKLVDVNTGIRKGYYPNLRIVGEEAAMRELPQLRLVEQSSP